MTWKYWSTVNIMLLNVSLYLSNKYDLSFVTYVDRNKYFFSSMFILTRKFFHEFRLSNKIRSKSLYWKEIRFNSRAVAFMYRIPGSLWSLSQRHGHLLPNGKYDFFPFIVVLGSHFGWMRRKKNISLYPKFFWNGFCVIFCTWICSHVDLLELVFSNIFLCWVVIA